jgi:hypothetical protein
VCHKKKSNAKTLTNNKLEVYRTLIPPGCMMQSPLARQSQIPRPILFRSTEVYGVPDWLLEGGHASPMTRDQMSIHLHGVVDTENTYVLGSLQAFCSVVRTGACGKCNGVSL